MGEAAIVLCPVPLMGHLISLVEFGKLILSHHPTFSIHILLPSVPNSLSFPQGTIASYISSVSTAVPSIKFHNLPIIITHLQKTPHPHPLLLLSQIIQSANPQANQALVNISKTHVVKALVLDIFCSSFLSLATELNIPAYIYHTSGAAALSCWLYLPTLEEKTTKSLKELANTPIEIPGIQTLIPAKNMPEPILDRNSIPYRLMMETCALVSKSSGIIANTFEALEAKAVKAIRDGVCVFNRPTPPLYCIGPLMATAEDQGSEARNIHQVKVGECLKWLDSQPLKSVIFLCFGSMGTFSKEQLREIAIGLEKSGQRFLWVVRNPVSFGDENIDHVDLQYLLPEGFLERTKERGFVVKRWAPQIAVLNHGSVGGFVTHCGWNSILEAVWAGVPMLAWPLYAEQPINKVVLVDELKMAIPMDLESSDGFVSGAEVEKRVRELMQGEQGKLVRARVDAMKEAAKASLSQGGSSHVNLGRFLDSL